VCFDSGVKGMALNLQHDHVGVVIFGQDHAIHQGGWWGRVDVFVCLCVCVCVLGVRAIWRRGAGPQGLQ
jgi:F0F1-type ATP synthase alpha subunit